MTTPKLLAMLTKQEIAGQRAPRLAQGEAGGSRLGAEISPRTPPTSTGSSSSAGRQTLHRPPPAGLQPHAGRGHRHPARLRLGPRVGRLFGLVTHDSRLFETEPAQALEVLREADRRLSTVPDSPMLFVEYASGIAPLAFASVFEQLRRAEEGERLHRRGARGHPGLSARLRRDRPARPRHLHPPAGDPRPRAASSTRSRPRSSKALPTVLSLVERLTSLGKPVHFHLHDGHPLSPLSPYGVADHLAFLQPIRLPFNRPGEGQMLSGMFRPAGLRTIVRAALAKLPSKRVSFMLEIHPRPAVSRSASTPPLFSHWADTTNAERMNYWLENLVRTSMMVRATCPASSVKPSGEALRCRAESPTRSARRRPSVRGRSRGR